MPAEEKAAYLMALLRCPDEVFGSWRLDTFLEQRDFDAKRTAKNLVEYWQKRLDLFGDDKCYLPMTLEGAMQDEVPGMMTYCIQQISPVKDAAGRTVVVANPSRRVKSLFSTESQSKAYWYINEVIAQDPEARRCGGIAIMDSSDATPATFDPTFEKFAVSLIDIFPIPWKAVHIVNASILVSRFILPVQKFLMGKRLRHRIIAHEGPDSNTIERMQTYALPPDRLPTEFGGEVVVNVQAWI